MTRGPQRALRRAAACAIALSLSGCAGSGLLGPAGSWKRPAWLGTFRKSAPPGPPPLVESPAAELPAPKGLRVGPVAYRVISLQWDPLLQSDVGGYAIERASAPDAPFERIAALWDRGETSYVDGGTAPLGDGFTAYYRLRCFAPDGRLSAEASPVVVGSSAPVPAAPTALRAFSNQPREVPLAWRASESEFAAGYVALRSPSPDGPYEIVGRLSGRYVTSFVDRGLGNLRVLYYRVATTNAGGATGSPSDPVRAVTKPEPLPPIGLRMSDAGVGRVRLTWDRNVETDIEEYRLYRVRKSAPPRLVDRAPAGRFEAEDRHAEAGERASYALVAVDRDGLESRQSDPVVAESQGYALEAQVGEEGVSLRWLPRPEEFAQARVVRSGWLREREIARTPESQFVDRDVAPGHRYRYVVVLIRPDGSEAPPSQPLEVQVPDDAVFR